MEASPRLAMVGSETPHLSTRLRMAFTAWSTALSFSSLTASSFIERSNEPPDTLRTYMSVKSVETRSLTLPISGAVTVTIPVSGSPFTSAPLMPLRSSSAAISSARRTAFSRTARSTSTPITRWMPPCRSSPRFRCFAGAHLGRAFSKTLASLRSVAGRRKYVTLGTSAQIAKSVTPTISPAFQYHARSISSPSLLRRLFRRLLFHRPVRARDLRLEDAQLDVVGHLDEHQVAGNAIHPPHHPARGDHLVALPQLLQEGLVLVLLPRLRPHHD